MSSTREPHLVTDPVLAEILAQLIRREPIFHRPEFGMTRADFENMTTQDYWEVGASGRRYSRNYVLDILEERFQQDQSGDIWETSDFYCKRLVLQRYVLTICFDIGTFGHDRKPDRQVSSTFGAIPA